jgi:Tol biopolymer transport system component
MRILLILPAAALLGTSLVVAQTSRIHPEIFAAGSISTRENELNAAFTPDGRTVYFTRKGGDGGRFGVILSSRATRSGGWSRPEVVPFSGRYADYDPILSPDGSRLFFISNRPRTPEESGPRRDFDIWVVESAGPGWGAPRNLGAPINRDGDELYPSVAADGSLYFSSCDRADSRGRCDLYRSRWSNGRYLDPENLGDSLNTRASETDAYVAPDQSYLVFTAYGRPDAVGDGDLYVSFFRNGAWSSPRPLGPEINSVAREYCPIVSPDGKYLYFTSQRGFTDAPPGRGLTAGEVGDSLQSLRNGFGNIYRVPLSVLLDPNRRP